MATAEIELEPCPWHGDNSDLQIEDNGGGGCYWIVCNKPDCGCEGPYAHSEAEAIAKWNRRTNAATHRHKKRGTEYVLIGFGKMQAEGCEEIDYSASPRDGDPSHRSVDMREVAIYQSVDDGSLWVRPREEFEDGRFEETPNG